ncbi:hypothetical protein pb186bvf_009868 [Paramecium bursaria]
MIVVSYFSYISKNYLYGYNFLLKIKPNIDYSLLQIAHPNVIKLCYLFKFILIIMMIFLLSTAILLSDCQKPIIDSSRSLYSSRDISDLEKKFSVWFTIMNSENQITEIFSITQLLQPELRLLFKKNLIQIEQQGQLIELDIKEIYRLGIWFHLEVSRDDDYYIQFHQPFNKKYAFQQNIFYAIIKSNFELNKACMIYKSLTNEIFPFSNEIQIDQMIETQIQQETFYFKHTRSNYQLYFSNFYLDITQEQISQWFCIILYFDIQRIEVKIQFFDSYFAQFVPNDQIESLFYVVTINQNFQTLNLKIIYNFNFDQDMKFQLNLKDLKTCGKNKYFDQEKLICRQFLDDSRITAKQQTQIKDTSNIDKFNMGVLFEKDYITYNQKSMDILEISRLLEGFAIGKNMIIKYSLFSQTLNIMNQQYKKSQRNIKILQQTDNQILCQQYYFGGICQKRIRNCKNVNEQNYCISCDYQYFLNKRKCEKCPQNCLICQYYKKQLICLIPLHHYYVNQVGITRYCECQQCKYGRCIEVQEYNSLRIQDKCLIKICPDDLYYDIIKQTCFEIPSLTQQFLNYYIGFLESFNYDLEQTQYQICLLEDPIISLNQLNKFYFTQQLINTYKENLKQSQIQQYNNYYMNKYNLNCSEVTFDTQGDAVCGQFIQQKQKQEKCIDPPCEYYLKLENITIYLDSRYITYNHLTYDSLYTFILAIGDVGIQYQLVELDVLISWAFAETDSKKLSLNIIILEDNLPLHLKIAKFVLNIRFSNFLFLSNSILRFNIYFFDEIQIKDQILNFDFVIEIQTDKLMMKNLTIYNNMSQILIDQCYIVQFQDLIIFSIPQILIQNVNQLYIRSIYIESQEILQNIFQLSKIEFINFTIVQLNINISKNLQLAFNSTVDSNIFQIERSYVTYISKLTIRDKLANNSQLFFYIKLYRYRIY